MQCVIKDICRPDLDRDKENFLMKKVWLFSKNCIWLLQESTNNAARASTQLVNLVIEETHIDEKDGQYELDRLL